MEKQNWKNVTIVLLSIGIVISIIVIIILTRRVQNQNLVGQGTEKYSPKGIYKIDTIGPVVEETGRANVASFHEWVKNGRVAEGSGVYYTLGDFTNYEKDVFPKIVAAQIEYMVKNGKDTAGYDWKIGCYWMLNRDKDDRIKYDFCFAPVMVDRSTKKVIDFFHSDRYGRELEIRIPKPKSNEEETVSTSVFNTGTMFP